MSDRLYAVVIDFVICTFRDREIQFYELSSFEPYCQISGLESVPLKMDYWYLLQIFLVFYMMKLMIFLFPICYWFNSSD